GGVISRAVASIPETLARVAGCLEVGGRMIFMKGPDCEDEIDAARTSHEPSFRLSEDHAYEIPGTSHRRRLLVYERLAGDALAGEQKRRPAGHPGPLREISSESNPAFRLCQELLTGRGIRKHRQALLAGPRIVGEVLLKFPDRVDGWLTGGGGDPPPDDRI